VGGAGGLRKNSAIDAYVLFSSTPVDPALIVQTD
jgi:hypothetical protein